MKDFFRECLEQLEDRTGLRQLFFLKSQCETQGDFDKRKNVLLESMVVVSKRFNYIPDEAQKKYISRMIVEDQQYDSLNSRTIWKWLDLHKDKHMTAPKISEDELTPAPPEVAEKYIAEFYANLAKIGNPLAGKAEEILKGVKRKETGRSKFVIDGIEIWAMSQEEAQKAYDVTFK